MSDHSTIFQNALTTILVVCAVIITGVAIYSEFFSSRGTPYADRRISDWRELTIDRHANIGLDGSKLNIIEFSDYECPFCRALEPTLEALVKKYPRRVDVIRYDLPLTSIHPFAFKAAIAARCAEAQGIYEPFEARLFAANTHFATLDWASLARSAGVADVPQFSDCLRGQKTAPLVKSDMKVATNLDLDATPVVMIRGNILSAYGRQNLGKVVAGDLGWHWHW